MSIATVTGATTATRQPTSCFPLGVLVGRGRHGAGVCVQLVVGHFRDGFRPRLDLSRQERPEVAGVEAAAQLGLLPSATDFVFPAWCF